MGRSHARHERTFVLLVPWSCSPLRRRASKVHTREVQAERLQLGGGTHRLGHRLDLLAALGEVLSGLLLDCWKRLLQATTEARRTADTAHSGKATQGTQEEAASGSGSWGDEHRSRVSASEAT